MDNLIDVYTRLKLKIGSIINIVYYTKDGTKHTEEFYLLDIAYFSHIWVIKEETNMIDIPFISKECIIESITFKENNYPVYINTFLKQSNNYNPFDNYEQIDLFMNQKIECNQEKLKERKKHINSYLAKMEYIEYDDLFFSDKQKEEFELFFSIIIKELSEYAKANNLNSDLTHIFTGTTSIVYSLGDKIIKIGKPRRTPVIPYCEYILQPIINRTLEFDGYPIHIEITQKVYVFEEGYTFNENTDTIKYFQSMKSFLEAKLKKIGLRCDDIILENIGILLEDNKIHFPSITFDTSSSQVTSIENNNNLKILPKGKPVIIDLDCIEIEDIKKYTKYLKKIGLNKGKKRVLTIKHK